MGTITGDTAYLLGYECEWKLSRTRNGSHWTCGHPKYGKVESMVVTNDQGYPLYDRPGYFEAPHIIAIPWGNDADGRTHIGLILERRPHVINPDHTGRDVEFWGVVRGFMNGDENPEESAIREVAEEMGATYIRNVRMAGHIFPNPSFVATSGQLVFIEVDIFEPLKPNPDRCEVIKNVEFFSINTVLQMIAKGEHEGGRLEDAVALSAILKFISWQYTEKAS